MPKKSKKSKSKRVTLRQKYKVLRKVREHHRKKRKEAKKNGTLRKSPKDPGIPNNWPFKEELLAQMKAQKDRAAAREKSLREAARLRGAAAQADLQALQRGAELRGRDFQQTAGQTAAGNDGLSFVDYSLRAFYRDFARVVEASDVIIEVLDARDPAGTRCMDVERFVRRMGPTKRVILLLNKIDLVPREVVDAWLKYLREELPAVAFKCSTQRQATNLGRKTLGTAADAAFRGSECLGAETLLQLLKNYARTTGGIKTSITVGVVGLPNVGKSSLINSLKRTRVAQVGNAPGVTKSVQEVHLDKQVTLLDSPGVVFADAGADGAAAAALRNCVKVEQLEDPALPVAEIVRRCPAKQLMQLYKVPRFGNVDEFLQHVATARGKLRRGGTVDTSAAARTVLQDWNDGRIQYYTLPAKRNSEVEGTAAVVSGWGAEFDAAEVFAAEQTAVIAGLPSLEDAAGDTFFQTKTMGEVEAGLDAAAAAADREDEHVSDMEDIDAAETSDSDGVGAMEDEKGPTNSQRRERTSKEAQNLRLYSEHGQFNPHSARAERKRRKSAKVGANDEEGGDSDFDFEADWDDAADGNAFAQLAEGRSSGGESEEDAADME